MRNTVILDRNFFQGSASKKCSTSPAMVELMKNPKIASVLFDQSRQEAFFKVGTGSRLGCSLPVFLSYIDHPIPDFWQLTTG